ncbi:MAG: laccase domain-containing protein, partial [Gemmatimonadales bacterium]
RDTAQGWQILEGMDGHATAQPGILLTVTVADCIPVYLVAPAQRTIALLHAGWRGTAAGILGHALGLLESARRINPSDIVMHCGVGICGDCYEVGSEVMLGCGMSPTGAGPWHLDLRDCLVRQAAVHGVGHISTSQWCSGHDQAHFYSHRASRGRDGRMVAYLGLIDGSG